MGELSVLMLTLKENQKEASKTTQLNTISTPQSIPEGCQKTAVARICAMSTKNPKLGQRVALKYLKLAQKVQEDLKDDNYPDHIHTA